MMKLIGALVAIVTATLLGAGSAGAVPAATGVITGTGKTLKVVDAFAFDDVGQFGDPVIRIRLSDRVLDRKAVDAAIDTLFELNAQRGQAGYLDLFVDKTGSYQGATYELGGSVSCAYCMEPEVDKGSKLRVEAGHVRGSVKVAAGSYNKGKGMGFDVTLDVPVAVPAASSPLTNAAAGPEAKAFLACQALAAKKDETSRSTCFAPDNTAVRSPTTKQDPSLFWTMLTAYDPVFEMTGLKITKGRTRGEWIELTIEGDSGGSPAKGAVYLRRTAGVIQYSHSVIE